MSTRRIGYRCADCKAVTWASHNEKYSASRLRCSSCGGLYLDWIGKGVATGVGDRAEPLVAHRGADGRRQSHNETTAAIHSTPEPKRHELGRNKHAWSNLSPEEQARRRIVRMRRLHEDYTARRKHGWKPKEP